MINLQINPPLQLPVDPALLEQAALQTLAFAGNEAAEATLVIGDDELLQQLNLEYRSIDAPTDVLSFAAGEKDPETGALYLGDVLISLPRARAQAEAGKHRLADELQLLAVHGLLHLLGYDHGEDAEKQRMQAAQDAVLALLGCAIRPQL
ncbi:MAG: rRNA maturation RNase YbeY [Anaerolineales bacterium]|nr:rRNA maturation RNase YbeY [Anaerolineales bacterium]